MRPCQKWQNSCGIFFIFAISDTFMWNYSKHRKSIEIAIHLFNLNVTCTYYNGLLLHLNKKKNRNRLNCNGAKVYSGRKSKY